MSMLRWLELPFRYTTTTDFERKLNNWLGEVFYERLPAAGFEVREEQIYTAYRIAQALCQRQTLFAEAGSGTGKTFAYLLSSLCYARMVGKAVIISSANAALQEQLIGPQGDIATLSRLLDLNIDARLAKDPSNHLCQLKAERLSYSLPRSLAKRRLAAWAEQTKLGDRSEIPDISDELWQQVAWDDTLYCDLCRRRGYCQVANARQHYTKAQDFIVCSHDVFFAHLWSRRARLAERQLPILPDFAAVVFDEGHLVEQPALQHLGHPLRQQTIDDVLQDISIYRNHYRTVLLLCLEACETAARQFFAAIEAYAIPHAEATKWAVDLNEEILDRARSLANWLEQANDHIAIETQLHRETVLEFDLNAYIRRLDVLLEGLQLLTDTTQDPVVWWEPNTATFWILPRRFSNLLGQELTSKRIPLIFTSATLQADGSFAGLKNMLGLPEAKQACVGTSFDLANQIKAYLPPLLDTDDDPKAQFTRKVEHCLKLIEANAGKALVLLRAQAELKQWQAYINARPSPFPYRILWEGEQNKSWLLEQFKQDATSVLIGTEFWEGVDVPGEALSLVVVFSLPYPWDDPLFHAKRRTAEQRGLDPYLTVDVPAMVIKLRQGYGRLIRLATDRGILVVLDLGPGGRDRQLVINALPEGVKVYDDIQDLLGQHYAHKTAFTDLDN
ncbi:MAG: ATP-dependent DNA helicase [Firmicutes bacterium]|nr:ATP-dependent DNA helicase [Bacillota bacterium]